MTLLCLIVTACTTADVVHCSSSGRVVRADEGLVREPAACAELRHPGHTLTGTVVEVDKGSITVNHDAIEGYMPAMTMDLALPIGEPVDATAGDRIRAHLIEHQNKSWLVDVITLSRGELTLRKDVSAVHVGQSWPSFGGRTEGGEPYVATGPTVLSFLYTRCPNPEFCPALVARLLALQEKLPEGSRIVTVSLDSDYDTPDVLQQYGRAVGADPQKWSLVHAEHEVVQTLVLQAGQTVVQAPGGIRHAHRLMVLDAKGVLLERYDHNRWAIDRVLSQLETGQPVGLHP